VEIDRYHRQSLLPQIGREGQERLGRSHVLLVGCGALGGVIAEQLARSGVGFIRIADRDVVELTNLQRQVLFDERDAAEQAPKAIAAQRRLAQINSTIVVEPHVVDVNPANVEELAGVGGRPVDVILDGTDNVDTRYLINDVSVKNGIPWIYGACVGTEGRSMAIVPPATACLRCVFPQPPGAGELPTCDTAGVLGPIIATIAAYQATEAIKLLLGRIDLVATVLMETDLWSGIHRRVDVAKARRAGCPCCGLRRFEFLDGERGGQVAALCGQNAVQVAPAEQRDFDLGSLSDRLAPHGTFTHMPSLLVRGTFNSERGEGGEPIGLTVFADGRAIVKGTAKPELARTVYARYVGA